MQWHNACQHLESSDVSKRCEATYHDDFHAAAVHLRARGQESPDWARIHRMHPLIHNNREAITNLCHLYGVSRLEAFGSIVRGDFDAARSDVDILVEFDQSVAASFTNFLNLKESLEVLLGRSVDLVELRAVRNRRLRHYIEQSRFPIYDAA